MDAKYNVEACRIWAKMERYKAKAEQTHKVIGEMLNAVKSPYIAFSCGKDSSVLADMVLSHRPDVPLRFISSGETRLIHNVETVIDYFREKYGAVIDEINIDRVFSEAWKGATFDEQRKAGRRDIQNIDNSGYDGVFMGLRKQESRGRQISLNYRKTDGLPEYSYKYKRGFVRFCPLADWRVEDVGAYIVTHDIPTLDWYAAYGFEGRTTARLTGDAVRQNTLFYLQYRNPEGYAAITRRFPELKIY